MYEKIIDIEVRGNYIVRATFSDGTVKDCDLQAEISTKPFYEPLHENPDLMLLVHPVGNGSAIGWTDEIDMASEWIWEHGTPT